MRTGLSYVQQLNGENGDCPCVVLSSRMACVWGRVRRVSFQLGRRAEQCQDSKRWESSEGLQPILAESSPEMESDGALLPAFPVVLASVQSRVIPTWPLDLLVFPLYWESSNLIQAW